MSAVQSVVDYDAWRKGYMPPSEHILIDQLSHRGAKVICASDHGDMAFWLVWRGDRPSRKVRKLMMEMMNIVLDAAFEETPVIASEARSAVYDEYGPVQT